MSTLYVTEPGARIEKEYHRLLVTKDDEVLLRVPVRKVTAVVLVGRVGVTTPALQALLAAEIPLWLVSRTGELLGRLLPPTAANLPLRQAQFRRNDDENFAFALARAIVSGKIRNQYVLAARLARRRGWKESASSALELLRRAIGQAQEAQTPDSLRGIEGQAAKRYFGLYRRAFAPDWAFTRRTRRPPRDPVNTLLSLGYVFLGHALMSALEVVGLDPYLGFFHAEKYGRPALALDLVEEFRAPVVDSLVLNLINHRILRPDHFEEAPTGEGIHLTWRGMRIFLTQFSAQLESERKVRQLGRRLSYRKIFEVQARRLARVIQGEEETYRPFALR